MTYRIAAFFSCWVGIGAGITSNRHIRNDASMVRVISNDREFRCLSRDAMVVEMSSDGRREKEECAE